MKVQIVRFEDEEIVKEIECSSERQAEKVDRGLQINLNHDKYFTRVSHD